MGQRHLRDGRRHRADRAATPVRALLGVAGTDRTTSIHQGPETARVPPGREGLLGWGAKSRRAAWLQLRYRPGLLRVGGVAGAGPSVPEVRPGPLHEHALRSVRPKRL